MLRQTRIFFKFGKQKPKYSSLKLPDNIPKVSEILASGKDPVETQTRIHTDLFYAACKLYGIDIKMIGPNHYGIDIKTKEFLDDYALTFGHETWINLDDDEQLYIMDKVQMSHGEITQYLWERRNKVKEDFPRFTIETKEIDDKIMEIEKQEYEYEKFEALERKKQFEDKYLKDF